MMPSVERRIFLKVLTLSFVFCAANAIAKVDQPFPEEQARRSPSYTAVSSPVIVPFSAQNVTFDQASHVLYPSPIQITLDSFRIELFQEELSTGEYNYYYMPVFAPVWSSLKTVYNKLTKRSTVTLDIQVWSTSQEERIEQALRSKVFIPVSLTLRMFPMRHLVFTTNNPDSGINAPSRWIDYALKPNVLSVSMACPSRDDMRANDGCQTLLDHLREYPDTLVRNMVVDISLTELPAKDLQRPLYSGYSGVEVEDLTSKVAHQQQLISDLQNYTQELRSLLKISSEALPKVSAYTLPCGQNVVLSKGQTALLQSPNHPFDYNPGSDCQFSIAANNGQTLQFSTQFFALEHCADCGCDFLTVSNKGPYCGSADHNGGKLPPAFFNTTPPTTVRFKTDGSNQYAGFRIAVTVV